MTAPSAQFFPSTTAMAVVWIIEKQKASSLSAAQALMGDFAVRVFASVESFQKLLRVSRKQLPQVVLIDVEDSGQCVIELCHSLGRTLGAVPFVLLHQPSTSVGGASRQIPERAHLCEKPVDGLGISTFVDAVMRGTKQNRSIIRYRDLVLDYERFHYVLAHSDEKHSLPLKEAQLLKLFLEQPGVCLSRERIQTAIWSSVSVTPRTIDSHVSRLRKRLQDAEVSIESIYGDGYVLR